MAKSTDERLDELEIVIAHQARLLEELNEVVVRQEKHINRLESIVEALSERFRAMEEQTFSDVPVTKPPHW
ncbi:SlyX family protein [Oricola sp.]|uniref:SlyX family protein n=1 Tax=Oricola sp. TaxID=1979950 RepID=UPI003BAB88BE